MNDVSKDKQRRIKIAIGVAASALAVALVGSCAMNEILEDSDKSAQGLDDEFNIKEPSSSPTKSKDGDDEDEDRNPEDPSDTSASRERDRDATDSGAPDDSRFALPVPGNELPDLPAPDGEKSPDDDEGDEDKKGSDDDGDSSESPDDNAPPKPAPEDPADPDEPGGDDGDSDGGGSDSGDDGDETPEPPGDGDNGDDNGSGDDDTPGPPDDGDDGDSDGGDDGNDGGGDDGDDGNEDPDDPDDPGAVNVDDLIDYINNKRQSNPLLTPDEFETEAPDSELYEDAGSKTVIVADKTGKPVGVWSDMTLEQRLEFLKNYPDADQVNLYGVGGENSDGRTAELTITEYKLRPPKASDDEYSVDEGGQVKFSGDDLMDNDTVLDGEVTDVNTGGVKGLSWNPETGEVTFDASEYEAGDTVEFTYDVRHTQDREKNRSGQDDVSTGTVTITVGEDGKGRALEEEPDKVGADVGLGSTENSSFSLKGDDSTSEDSDDSDTGDADLTRPDSIPQPADEDDSTGLDTGPARKTDKATDAEKVMPKKVETQPAKKDSDKETEEKGTPDKVQTQPAKKDSGKKTEAPNIPEKVSTQPAKKPESPAKTTSNGGAGSKASPPAKVTTQPAKKPSQPASGNTSGPSEPTGSASPANPPKQPSGSPEPAPKAPKEKVPAKVSAPQPVAETSQSESGKAEPTGE